MPGHQPLVALAASVLSLLCLEEELGSVSSPFPLVPVVNSSGCHSQSICNCISVCITVPIDSAINVEVNFGVNFRP